MKLKFYRVLALVGLCSAAAGMGNAATYNLADGGILCEGPNSLLPSSVGCDTTNTFGDGGQTGGPDVNLLFSGSGSGGEATIFGGVRGKDDNRFADVFTIVGTGKYRFTLSSISIRDTDGNLLTPASDFDATWSFGGLDIGTMTNLVNPAVLSLSTIFDFTSLAPEAVFKFDAAGGQASNGSYMQYRVDISAVPLPASSLLLLGGLGGLAAMRRKKKAAK
jgi:hypothetical protein